MGKLLMDNFNKKVRNLLPEDLKRNISKAMRKNPKPKGYENVTRMLDLRPSLNEMSTAGVISELQLNGEEELANNLLNHIILLEGQQRNYTAKT